MGLALSFLHRPAKLLTGGALLIWALLAVARLSVVLEPPAALPGRVAEPFFAFARAIIPEDAAYLYVQTDFAPERGISPRLRYELFPRRYVDVDMHVSLEEVRAILAREAIRYVVFPAPELFGPDHWVSTYLQPRGQRIPLDEERYILLVGPEP